MLESQRQALGLERFVSSRKSDSQVYGLQWGDPEKHGQLRRVLDNFLLPHLRPTLVVVEIGSGGGRWSQYFAGRVSKAYLVDATPASETAIRSHCNWPGFQFLLSSDGMLPQLPTASIDFAFSFDTFVHFDIPLFDRYIVELGRVLAPGAMLVLHYARRWPECAQNDNVFAYREDHEVASLLHTSGFALTGNEDALRGGFGSIVREAIKLP